MNATNRTLTQNTPPATPLDFSALIDGLADDAQATVDNAVSRLEALSGVVAPLPAVWLYVIGKAVPTRVPDYRFVNRMLFDIWSRVPRSKATGDFMRRKDGSLKLPQWQVDDLVLIALATDEGVSCPALAEVAGPPAVRRGRVWTPTEIVCVSNPSLPLSQFGITKLPQGGRRRLKLAEAGEVRAAFVF